MKMPSVQSLLPHDPPMVLLDEVHTFQDDEVHASLVIKETSPFCENGSVAAYVAVEYMAQTIGVWRGLLAQRTGDTPQLGLLLGTRKLELNRANFNIGEKLDVYAKEIYREEELGAFACRVEIKKEVVASASLNVFQPKDVKDFLK